MGKIELKLLFLSESNPANGSYILVLAEVSGKRRLHIIIGAPEANAIHLHLQGNKPKRPLTHDLFVAFSKTFGVELVEVFIREMNEGIFYSSLVCKKDNEMYEIDARTSDALALAVRFNCPIFVSEKVMIESGSTSNELFIDEIFEEGEEGLDSDEIMDEIFQSSVSVQELEQKLNDALANEDYEAAARYRDELMKRKK